MNGFNLGLVESPYRADSRVPVRAEVKRHCAAFLHRCSHPPDPAFRGLACIAASPGGTQVRQGVPLRAIHPTRGRKDIERLVQFAGCVILGTGVADQLDAWIEGDNRPRVASFYRVGIDTGDGFVEVDMLVATVEPPARDFVAVTRRPFVDDLGPLVRELLVDRLVLASLRQSERRWARRSAFGVWQGR